MITLKTLPQATAQQVFDQVANHLLLQNYKSYEGCDDDTGSCKYRGPNNLKCAAGSLIANDEYRERFEDQGWLNLVDNGDVPNTHSQLIVCLQNVHDCNAPEEWPERLKFIAKMHQLSAVVV